VIPARARLAGLLLALTLPAACAAQAQVADSPESWTPEASQGWSLVWPAGQTKVVFKGVVNLDGAGLGPGGMLYPAPNAAGLVVAILTHAALNEGMKSSQKAALQAEADKVLADYASLIDGFAPEDLLRRVAAVGGAWPAGLRAHDGSARWEIELQPLFQMAQDRRALVVDTVVTVRERGVAKAARVSAVRLVSDPLAAEGAAQAWATQDGQTLKDQSARLLARALALSFADMSGRWNAPTPQRTVRFMEGGQERIERAHVIDSKCGRAVVRTLRGDLMEVPLRAADSAAQSECAAAAPAEPAASQTAAPTAQ
jgi:hypothetical protein